MALKSKFQIGSVHGRINYDLSEHFFHPTDVPSKVSFLSSFPLLRKHMQKTVSLWMNG